MAGDTESDRRARIARRHFGATSAEAAARRLVCLHATDPATIVLSAFARVEGLAAADVEAAPLIKHLSMRRTLFMFPRDAVFVDERVAATEEKRLLRDVAHLHGDPEAWLRAACAEVLTALDGREATMAELRADIPALEGHIDYGEGRSWGGRMAIGPRVLTVLSARGEIVRTANDGPWWTSRPRWGLMPAIGRVGVTGMVERYLRAFGPATERDVKWWLGSTLGIVRAAFAELGAVDRGDGYVMPDDTDPVVPVEPWAALLPGLDPTTMGWHERDWYLGPHKQLIFDSAGNAGPTMWWDGRIVGGWRQTDGGDVELQYLDDPGADAREAFDAEAHRLGAFLAGTPVTLRFPSPLFRR